MDVEQLEFGEVITELCQCCLSTCNLKSMTEPFIVESSIEVYYDMMTKCFKDNLLVLNPEECISLSICEECIGKLRLCCQFRRQVEAVQAELYGATGNQHYDTQNENDNAKSEAYEANYECEAGNENVININKHDYSKQVSGDDDCEGVTGRENVYRVVRHTPSLEDTIKKALKKVKHSDLHDTLLHKQLDDNNDKSAKNSDDESLHKRVVHIMEGLERCVERNKEYLERFIPPGPKAKQMATENYEKSEEYKKTHVKRKQVRSKPYHVDKMDNVCNICGEEFYTYQTLVHHMNSHFPKYICDKCGKSFALRAGLRAHIRTHEEGIPCEICNKKITKRNLAKHVNAHMGKKDVHRCPICNERFEKFSTRAMHMEKEHDIVKRYKCKWCDKVFNLVANLKLHIRDQHNAFNRVQPKTPRKPVSNTYECTPCDKTFKQKLHLDHHEISKHSKVKNYQCHICARSYYLKYTLNQHLKDYHYETEKFSCHICNRVFKVKRMVTRHIKRVHNKQSSEENTVEVG